jgi:ribosomal protein L16 Arg81 hydroxylase
MQQTVLDDILAPLSTDTFMANHWLRRPLHQAGSPDRFSFLLAESDLEYLAATLPAPHPSWVVLVRDGTDMPPHSLTGQDGKINLHKFRQTRADGYTLLLAQLDRRWPAISAFCRALEAAFIAQGVAMYHPLIANAYSTPAGARGLKVHHDDHEVLVMQIAGRKRWRFYQPLDAPPVGTAHRVLLAEQYGTPQREIEMKPGDILYIPRGFPHDACANDEATLHLTLAINVHSWSDVVANLMLDDSLFRGALPPVRGGSQAQGAAWAAELARRLAQFDVSSKALSRIAANFDDELVGMLDPVLQAAAPPLGATRPLSLQSRIVHSVGSFFQFDNRGESVALLFPGGTQKAPPSHAEAFRYIAEHPDFTAAELPGLAEESKLQLVAILIQRGALSVAH